LQDLHRTWRVWFSRQNLLQHVLWFYLGYTLIQSLKSAGKAFVVDAKAMQVSCVQIIHPAWLVNDINVVTEGIGLNKHRGTIHGEHTI